MFEYGFEPFVVQILADLLQLPLRCLLDFVLDILALRFSHLRHFSLRDVVQIFKLHIQVDLWLMISRSESLFVELVDFVIDAWIGRQMQADETS